MLPDEPVQRTGVGLPDAGELPGEEELCGKGVLCPERRVCHEGALSEERGLCGEGAEPARGERGRCAVREGLRQETKDEKKEQVLQDNIEGEGDDHEEGEDKSVDEGSKGQEREAL